MSSPYRPGDREEKLGPVPEGGFKPDDPKVIAWEAAHGHDLRLECLPEFGCQLLREHDPPMDVTVHFCSRCDEFWTQGIGGRSSAWKRCDQCGEPMREVRYTLPRLKISAGGPYRIHITTDPRPVYDAIDAATRRLMETRHGEQADGRDRSEPPLRCRLRGHAWRVRMGNRLGPLPVWGIGDDPRWLWKIVCERCGEHAFHV